MSKYININGKLFHLDTPKIMGILNLTPDSFYDGGKNNSQYLKKVETYLNEGAEFIDIGGMSTRPGAEDVSEEEELKRIIDPIIKINTKFPEAIISVDTFRSKVASEAVSAGANMINDISAGAMDPKMFETIKLLDVPYIIMHIQGTPKNMQQNPTYNHVVKDILKYFGEKLIALNKLGVKDVIIDPGFGFGKTVEHNYQLLKGLDLFKNLNVPILVGISRKSMINKVLGTKPEQALNGTSVLNTISILNGANILRVHDVKEAKETIKLVSLYKQTEL